jgi:hypothetical protein
MDGVHQAYAIFKCSLRKWLSPSRKQIGANSRERNAREGGGNAGRAGVKYKVVMGSSKFQCTDSIVQVAETWIAYCMKHLEFLGNARKKCGSGNRIECGRSFLGNLGKETLQHHSSPY